MKPEIVEQEKIRILGIQRRIDPMTADYQKLWRDELVPYYATIGRLGKGQGWFGVYFPAEEEGRVDFVAGMAIDDLDEVPEGLVVREIKGGKLALFRCGLAELGETWRNIHTRWLPEAGYTEDEQRTCMEYFPPGCHEGRAKVEIGVPIEWPCCESLLYWTRLSSGDSLVPEVCR